MKRPGTFAWCRRFRCRNIEVHHNRILTAPYDHRFHGHVRSRIHFLMRDIRRNEDKIARACFVDEFEIITPAEARAIRTRVSTYGDLKYAPEITPHKP